MIPIKRKTSNDPANFSCSKGSSVKEL